MNDFNPKTTVTEFCPPIVIYIQEKFHTVSLKHHFKIFWISSIWKGWTCIMGIYGCHCTGKWSWNAGRWSGLPWLPQCGGTCRPPSLIKGCWLWEGCLQASVAIFFESKGCLHGWQVRGSAVACGCWQTPETMVTLTVSQTLLFTASELLSISP